MSNKLLRTRPLHRAIAASAAGLVFGCAGAFAASGNQASTSPGQANIDNTSDRSFPSVDQNNDQRLEWTEIRTVYEDDLRQAGWEETMLMNEFDANQDQQLDAQEYVVFLSGLSNGPTTRQEAINRQAVNGPDDQQQSQSGRQGQTQSVVQNPDQQQSGQIDVVQDDPSSLDRRGSNATDANANSQNASGAHQASASSANQGAASVNGSQQESVAAGNSASQSQSSDANLTVEDVKQLPVQNMEGQQLGQVEDVVLRQDGSEAGLVISIAGNSPDGASEGEAKKVFVSLDQLMATQDHILWQTPLDSEAAQDLPAYNQDLYVSIQ